MPMVSTIPAMPGSVSVQLNAAIAPRISTMFSASATTETTPASR